MPLTVTTYRGEKSQWWPAPEIRLMSGMTLYQPWIPSSVSALWTKLQQEVKGQLGLSVAKKVAAYAQYLRASGRPFAVATAWTLNGAFKSDYNYVIRIPNVHVFYWGGTTNAPALGAAAPIASPNDVKEDFIVLNGPSIAQSTVLGFGHNTGTKEITFFHDLPIGFIASCNEKTPAQLNIKNKAQLTFDEKVKYSKFLR